MTGDSLKVGDRVRVKECDSIGTIYWGREGALTQTGNSYSFVMMLDKPVYDGEYNILVDSEELEKLDV